MLIIIVLLSLLGALKKTETPIKNGNIAIEDVSRLVVSPRYVHPDSVKTPEELKQMVMSMHTLLSISKIEINLGSEEDKQYRQAVAKLLSENAKTLRIEAYK